MTITMTATIEGELTRAKKIAKRFYIQKAMHFLKS